MEAKKAGKNKKKVLLRITSWGLVRPTHPRWQKMTATEDQSVGGAGGNKGLLHASSMKLLRQETLHVQKLNSAQKKELKKHFWLDELYHTLGVSVAQFVQVRVFCLFQVSQREIL